MNRNDNVIYRLHNYKLVRTANPIKSPSAEHNNFLIVSRYGDWSGFRTLAGCEAQIPELEKEAMTRRNDPGYAIVERL